MTVLLLSCAYTSYIVFSEEINCCESFSRSPQCFTIAIPSQDRFFSWVNDTATCLNFVRSTYVCNLNTREQVRMRALFYRY